jgi:hypothetical protein
VKACGARRSSREKAAASRNARRLAHAQLAGASRSATSANGIGSKNQAYRHQQKTASAARRRNRAANHGDGA